MVYIVLIGTDKAAADGLAEFFRAEGYRFGIAPSIRIAQRFLRHVQPDLLIIENSASGDGLALARLASKIGVPAILLSATLEQTKQAEKAGFICFQKPLRLTALSAAVSALLGATSAFSKEMAMPEPSGAEASNLAPS